jgi:hypothetical protein
MMHLLCHGDGFYKDFIGVEICKDRHVPKHGEGQRETSSQGFLKKDGFEVQWRSEIFGQFEWTMQRDRLQFAQDEVLGGADHFLGGCPRMAIFPNLRVRLKL